MITSKDNERLKLVRKLHDKRWREKLGLFFVEGEDAVAAAAAPPVDLLWAGEDVEPKLLADVASTPHPPRVVAVYRRADLPAWEERDATLALWHVSDPGNVGTLLRTAEAFGAAVVLSEGCADPTSPKALRASAGSIWRVPLGTWDDLGGRRVALVAHGGEASSLGRSRRPGGVPARRGTRRPAGRGGARRRRDDPDRGRRVAERGRVRSARALRASAAGRSGV